MFRSVPLLFLRMAKFPTITFKKIPISRYILVTAASFTVFSMLTGHHVKALEDNELKKAKA